MTEHFNHGAIHQPVKRWIHRKLRKLSGKRIARGMGVDWSNGSQFREKIGKLPVKNQGSSFSCGGQAASLAIQIDRIIRGVDNKELSAKSYYAPIAYLGGGTTISDLMQQVASVGGNTENTVPSYDVYGNPLSEAMMIEKSWMTPQTQSDALTRAGYTPYDIDDDIDAVAEAINTYGFVIWMITGQNGNSPDWRSPTPQPPSKSNPNPLWRHFMCAYDFRIKDGKKQIVAQQSEGPNWGEGGIQYFGEEYFNGKYLDAFTFIYDLNLAPNNDNHSIWAEIQRWFVIYFQSLKTA